MRIGVGGCEVLFPEQCAFRFTRLFCETHACFFKSRRAFHFVVSECLFIEQKPCFQKSDNSFFFQQYGHLFLQFLGFFACAKGEAAAVGSVDDTSR